MFSHLKAQFKSVLLSVVLLLPFGSRLLAEIDDATLLALSRDPVAVAEGKKIYQSQCFSCHGHRLEGGTGYDLRDGEWIHGSAPSSILSSIAKGFPEKGMVAYETVYDEATLANVVAYILSERVGFQDLRYQVYHAPAEPSSLEALVQGALTGEGSLPNGYADTNIPGNDTFAIVFKGGLIAPESGEVHLLVSQVFEHEISVFVDGRKAPFEAFGIRDFRFAIKNGVQDARIIYHKSDKRSRARMFLVGDELHAPISMSAKAHLAATNFLIQPSEQPIVLRRKIERLPPRSVAAGNLGRLHYAYNPVSDSIVGLWEGGFLNIGPNIAGRGKEASLLTEEIFLASGTGRVRMGSIPDTS